MLPGSEKYMRRDWSPKRPQTAVSRDIERANTVPMHRVLRELFNQVVPEDLDGSSYKIRCPFGYEHADGGMDKNCRLYDTHIWCFAQHGWLDPVKLVQRQFGIDSAPRAAEWLLNHYGLRVSRSYRDRYRELQQSTDSRRNIGPSAHVVSALLLSLTTMDEYELRQFDDDVVTVVNLCLERLDELLVRKAGEDELRTWLQTSRAEVAKRLAEGTTA